MLKEGFEPTTSDYEPDMSTNNTSLAEDLINKKYFELSLMGFEPMFSL